MLDEPDVVTYAPPVLTRLGSVAQLTLMNNVGSRMDTDMSCGTPMTAISGGSNPFC